MFLLAKPCLVFHEVYVCMYVCMYVNHVCMSCMYDWVPERFDQSTLITFFTKITLLLLYKNFILNTFSMKKLDFSILGFSCFLSIYLEI